MHELASSLNPDVAGNCKKLLNKYMLSLVHPVYLPCVCADDRAEGGLAGVQLCSGRRRSLYLHRRGSGAKPLLQRRQEQTATTITGEGNTTLHTIHTLTC